MDVGPSLLPVRRRGTLYRDICVILFTPLLSLHDYSRHLSFQSTTVYSALGAVFRRWCAILIYVLLTYFTYIGSFMQYVVKQSKTKAWEIQSTPSLWPIFSNIISYHIVVLKRQNSLKVGTDKPKLKVKMQSVSDIYHIISYVKFIVPPLHYIRPWVHYIHCRWWCPEKKFLEKPRFELAAKGVFRLGRCYIFWYGVPGLRASHWKSTAIYRRRLIAWQVAQVYSSREFTLKKQSVVTTVDVFLVECDVSAMLTTLTRNESHLELRLAQWQHVVWNVLPWRAADSNLQRTFSGTSHVNCNHQRCQYDTI